jgi:hypothetical protein
MKTKCIGYSILVLLIIVVGMVTARTLTWLYSERVADRSILTDSPCTAPCWQGIVPGTSTEREGIIQILETMPNVRSIRQYPSEIRWRWKQRPWRKTGYNSVYLVGGIVHHITLSVDFELTVEEILSKYGLPETTNAVLSGVPDHLYVGMNLLYPAQGLWFRAKVLPYYAPVLEPTTKVFEIMYSTPAESLESWLGSDIDDMHLQLWPGYGELEEVYNP